MIAGWLAGKLSGAIIFLLACLSIPFGIIAFTQTIRVDGLDLGGWYAIHGYKPLYEQDERDLHTLRDNQLVLTKGLDTCNASIETAKAAGHAMTDAANALIAAAAGYAKGLKSNIDAVAAIKASPTEQCPVADSILKRGFQ